MTWNTTNATTVTINQGIGTVAASGTRSVAPTATTTYTLTATNAAGSVTATATVTVAGTRITPTITWNTPASIVYGTALSGTQLNATTTVPGSWAYSPAARNGARGGGGTDAVGDVYPDRHRQLQLGERDGRDHRAEGDAAHHVGERRPTSAPGRRSAPRS